MHRYKPTSVASKNTRYQKSETIAYKSDILCEICGSKMIHDEYGIFRCENCRCEQSAFINDSMVY